MTPIVKTLMYRGGRYRFTPPPVSHAAWTEADWIAYIDGPGAWQPDAVDQMMIRQDQHVAWLLDFFKEMEGAGFTNLRIADPDLDRLTVGKHGAEAMIREMFQVDDIVRLLADYPVEWSAIGPHQVPTIGPHRVQLWFLLCNDAWECLADYSIPCEAVDEKLSAIVGKLEEKYA